MSFVLPCQKIQKMIDDRQIYVDDSAAHIETNQIQPASLDLRLGNVLYRTRASFLPRKNQNDFPNFVNDKIENSDMILDKTKILKNGALLECGATYVIPILEKIALPENYSMFFNPKSSTGRLDFFARVIGKNCEKFDEIPGGYRGLLWVELSPRSFPIRVHVGSRLVQGRIKTKLANEGTQITEKLSEKLVELDLKGQKIGSVIGYRAKRNTGLIDVEQHKRYAISDFWEPILADKSESIILDPSEFYILVSKENVIIPPEYAAELAPISTDFGEFRVHYAGFFDPGFGWSENEMQNASRAVLEVRAHNVPFRVQHGQTVGKLMYEPLIEKPDQLYGHDLKSNYQGQGLKLSKHFKQ